MDDREFKMLERLLAITEENNRILHKMHRAAVIKYVLHMVYVAVIIGLSFAAYYFIQPYIGSVDSALKAIDEVQNMPR